MRIGPLQTVCRPRNVSVRATLLVAASLAAGSCLPSSAGVSPSRLSERDKVVHLLSRATYGVRAQDVEEVLRVGRAGWLEQQLRPETIQDDVLETRIASRPQPQQQEIRVAVRPATPPGPVPAPMPNAVRIDSVAQRMFFEATTRANQQLEVTQRELERARSQLAEAQALAMRQGIESARSMLESAQARFRTAQEHAAAALQQFEELRRQMAAGLGGTGGGMEAPRRLGLVTVVSPSQALNTLVALKLERAVYTRRQLQEVMTDFWFNHFNVFYNKGQVRLVLDDYEQNAIRRNVFGRFEDMLVATARHPAMLVYLDNFVSTAPPPQPANGRPARQRGGLNENYARELLELHTLGVDGGYTQQDVMEVARAFTGWGVANRPAAQGTTGPAGRATVEFRFNEGQHATGDKVVLGQTVVGGRGMDEGLEILATLARHPSTARHVATKLVRHFVADEPPEELVERIAQVFLDSDGDLAEVTRALFLAAEFYDPSHYRAKVKRPFEYVASALRVVGAEVQPQGQGLVPQLRSFRHLPYSEAAPTGYATTAEDWVSAGAMLARMNFALDLVGGRLPGVSLSGDPTATGFLAGALPNGAAGAARTPAEVRRGVGAGVPAPEAGSGAATDPAADAELREAIATLLARIHVGASTESLARLIEEDLARPAPSAPAGGVSRGAPAPVRQAGRQSARISPMQRALALALGAPEFQRY